MKKRIKPLFAGLVCLILCFVSLSASSQTPSEEMYQKGRECLGHGNDTKAAKWWTKAAEQGDEDAQEALKEMDSEGL